MAEAVALSCRAQVHSDCKKNWVVPNDSEELTDSTLRGHEIVCDACYLVIEPFMQMNSGNIPDAADDALDHYRANLKYVRENDDLDALYAEARAGFENSMVGTPAIDQREH
jgi:hypothetical protein